MVHLPALAKHLTLFHLLLWALFIGVFIGVFIERKVRSLMLEPYVTAPQPWIRPICRRASILWPIP
jgi:hypothetical protein